MSRDRCKPLLDKLSTSSWAIDHESLVRSFGKAASSEKFLRALIQASASNALGRLRFPEALDLFQAQRTTRRSSSGGKSGVQPGLDWAPNDIIETVRRADIEKHPNNSPENDIQDEATTSISSAILYSRPPNQAHCDHLESSGTSESPHRDSQGPGVCRRVDDTIDPRLQPAGTEYNLQSTNRIGLGAEQSSRSQAMDETPDLDSVNSSNSTTSTPTRISHKRKKLQHDEKGCLRFSQNMKELVEQHQQAIKSNEQALTRRRKDLEAQEMLDMNKLEEIENGIQDLKVTQEELEQEETYLRKKISYLKKLLEVDAQCEIDEADNENYSNLTDLRSDHRRQYELLEQQHGNLTQKKSSVMHQVHHKTEERRRLEERKSQYNRTVTEAEEAYVADIKAYKSSIDKAIEDLQAFNASLDIPKHN